jgi:hypothetical protein
MLRILRPPGRACASPGKQGHKGLQGHKGRRIPTGLGGFLVLAVLAVLYVLASASRLPPMGEEPVATDPASAVRAGETGDLFVGIFSSPRVLATIPPVLLSFPIGIATSTPSLRQSLQGSGASRSGSSEVHGTGTDPSGDRALHHRDRYKYAVLATIPGGMRASRQGSRQVHGTCDDPSGDPELPDVGCRKDAVLEKIAPISLSFPTAVVARTQYWKRSLPSARASRQRSSQGRRTGDLPSNQAELPDVRRRQSAFPLPRSRRRGARFPPSPGSRASGRPGLP